MVRESADLLYNLTVLWASAGVQPEDVWREMERREHMLGIAEKLPKSAVKMPKRKATPPRIARRPIVALESRALRKRALDARLEIPAHSRHGQIRPVVVHRAMLRRIYDWCIDAAHKPYALWILGAVAFAESSFFPVPPDIMLLPMSLARPRRAWLFARRLHGCFGGRRRARLCHRRAAL